MNHIKELTRLRAFAHLFGVAAAAVYLSNSGLTVLAGTIDFEAPTYSTGSLLSGQDGWVSGSSEDVVVATANSGIYVGGQAAGHVDSGGAENVGRLGQSPAVGNTMQADFFGGDVGYDDDGLADTNLRMNAWIDADNDGNYDSGSAQGERSFQFGMDADAKFGIQFADSNGEIGSTDAGQSGKTFTIDTWYRITASWVDNVVSGKDVTLTAFDLTNNADLGTVLSVTLSDAEFGPDPSTYEGVGFRATRGLIDNISVVPEPSSVILLLFGMCASIVRRNS